MVSSMSGRGHEGCGQTGKEVLWPRVGDVRPFGGVCGQVRNLNSSKPEVGLGGIAGDTARGLGRMAQWPQCQQQGPGPALPCPSLWQKLGSGSSQGLPGQGQSTGLSHLGHHSAAQPSPAVPHGRFRFVFTSQDCVLLLLPVLWAVSRVLSSRVSILLELPSESEGTFWFVPSCCRTVVPMTLAQCPARPRARVCTAMVPSLKLSVR